MESGRFTMQAVAMRASETVPMTTCQLSGYNTRYGYPAVKRALKHGLIRVVGEDKAGHVLYLKA